MLGEQFGAIEIGKVLVIYKNLYRGKDCHKLYSDYNSRNTQPILTI